MTTESIEGLKSKIALLTKENQLLKDQLQVESEKESHHQMTIAKIKQIHSEYEASYTNAIAEYKARQSNLKDQFMEYQTQLENQYTKNEQRLNNEITQLKELIKSKEDTIANLIKQNGELRQTISKSELEWHCKEREYENAIELKENELAECKASIQSITEETTNKLNNLKNQVEEFYERKNLYGNGNVNVISETTNIEGSNQNMNHQIEMLINQNNQLIGELNKANQEIQFWKNVKNNMNESPSLSMNNNEFYKMRVYQLEDKIKQQGIKFNQSKNEYESSINMLQRENEQLRESYVNDVNSYNILSPQMNRLNSEYNTENNYNSNDNNYNIEEVNSMQNNFEHENIENEIGKNKIILQKVEELKNRMEGLN